MQGMIASGLRRTFTRLRRPSCSQPSRLCARQPAEPQSRDSPGRVCATGHVPLRRRKKSAGHHLSPATSKSAITDVKSANCASAGNSSIHVPTRRPRARMSARVNVPFAENAISVSREYFAIVFGRVWPAREVLSAVTGTGAISSSAAQTPAEGSSRRWALFPRAGNASGVFRESGATWAARRHAHTQTR